jgi:glycosyltransferase involved in cell wall biosynthesis
MNSKTIYVHDYMGGWLDRGIPLYTRNLVKALRSDGWTVITLSAAKSQRDWPRALNHLLGALAEQLVSPLLWRLRGASAAIFPYNAMPLVDVFSSRAHIVIHDVMAFGDSGKSYTRLYYRLVYALVKATGRRIFTVSPIEVERLRRFGFVRNPIDILPNGFAEFRERLASAKAAGAPTGRQPGEPASRLLLCSSRAQTKDLPGVWRKLLPQVWPHLPRIELLGMGGEQAGDARWLGVDRLDERVQVLPRLSDSEVVEAYLRNDIVWVHSRQEGFGRCIVEGRLAGKLVICNDIPEFRALADDGVIFYDSPETFDQALRRTLSLPPPAEYVAYSEHDALKALFGS